MKNSILLLLLGFFLSLGCNENTRKTTSSDQNPQDTITAQEPVARRWSKEKANQWYQQQPWLVGANYNPRTAINQLEMWQQASFDLQTIDQELGWAADLGMNTMRVYLHDLLHQQDPDGLYERMDQFLEVADAHGIKTLFVLFDSCWDPFPQLGEQRDPKPHVHNSGWVQSPGQEALQDSTQYPRLERYVKKTIAAFKDDERVLGWDLWNEPDNMTGPSYEAVEIPNEVALVYPLLEKSFIWARSVNPSQPLTSGVWIGDWSDHDAMEPIHRLQLEQSDIITFHNYDDPEEFEKRIWWLQRYDRPILCTEYMARPNGSTFEGFLPIAKEHKVGMYNWGFVDGKTQTKYPWDSWTKEYTAEPELWFHEVLRSDGTPYKQEETELIKQLTAAANQNDGA